ncbi:hypothetical protein QL285_025158 [Trifolium repens]|nr:hypothetical protein QL285_025158 [Trifolium repens]
MDAESSFSQAALPIFDGENYELWAVKMETYLEALDLWEAVEEDFEILPLPDNPTMAQLKNHRQKKTRKAKAKSCLFAGVSKTIFTRIMSLKTAREIWNYLKEEYAGDDRIRNMQVLNLIREFELQRMMESETIKEYSDKLLAIANKVRLLGTEFADSRIVQKILVTVPEKYEATITTLENTKDLSSITLAEVLHALKAQEQRRLMRQEGSMEGAFQAKLQINNKGKSPSNKPEVFTHNKNNNQNSNIYPPCPHCKKTNHLQKKCWWRPDARCHRCGQLGHMERVCKSQQQQEEVKVAEDLSQEEQLFAVTCYAAHSSAESWLIDSGCTNHMTYDRELFRELDEAIFSKVKIGNGAYIEVKGRGTVAIEGHTGLKLIHDVLYVPEINQNLLSVPQLLEKGYKVLFEDKNCMIKDSEGREVFNVQMKGKSFALDFMNKQQAAVHKEVNSTTLWHKRLGHFHHNALMYLKKNNLAKNSLELEEELPTCDVCQYGKQTRLPFPRKSAWRATERLQLIHTDVGGPMRTPSLNGIQSLDRSSKQVQTAERKNRTIMEMARCLLHEKELPKKFWAEAANTAVFLLNRLPTKALQKKTPFEAWIYLPHNGKVIVSRDVKFFELDSWNWEDNKNIEFQEENEDIDDEPIRGTRSLSDIYQRCNVAIMEPAGYAEAANDKKWIDAMEEELKMIEKNQTWKLVDRPDHKKAIGVKWVYRTKLNPDGSVNKYKARLVVKGYAQIFGVDFSETFAPVARLDTIRLLFALAAQNGWVIHQMDVKSAFLNGYLEEEIFVEQPEGFIVQGHEEKVYKLNKALYGLKQAPRSWYSRIDAHLVNLGFEKSPSEFTLYVKKVDNEVLVVSLYVDDLFVTGRFEFLRKRLGICSFNVKEEC